ncbi:hypothetical protein SETIT_9G116400v2 [Setaria italica]|uniref:Uncharacterized protein n=2 Tax=Setaria TaxID=4554 RepID=A0A368SFQ6_SETIT|nr:hypothetical protein SETIT_9G116400v2 [Setaria italica]TKV91708.1 hypothetical protein SEVIR_9G115300v2 [Setaria viridis]
MGVGVGARPSSLTRACALLLVLLALAAVGARGARTGPRRGGGVRGHRDRVGLALAGAARRSLLSKPEPSCCTHDPNTPGTSCCPQPFTP